MWGIPLLLQMWVKTLIGATGSRLCCVCRKGGKTPNWANKNHYLVNHLLTWACYATSTSPWIKTQKRTRMLPFFVVKRSLSPITSFLWLHIESTCLPLSCPLRDRDVGGVKTDVTQLTCPFAQLRWEQLPISQDPDPKAWEHPVEQPQQQGGYCERADPEERRLGPAKRLLNVQPVHGSGSRWLGVCETVYVETSILGNVL